MEQFSLKTFWGLSAADLMQSLGSSIEGLSQAEAKRRLAGHGANRIRTGKRRAAAPPSFYTLPMRATKKTATLMNNMVTAILTGVKSVPGRY